MTKKGQLTIIIILGILLLISSLTVFYIKYWHSKDSVDDASSKISLAYEDDGTFEYHVKACIEDVTREGLRKIGNSGGYINTTKHGLTYDPLKPTESDVLVFREGNPLKTAYWWYFKSSNSCTDQCECSSNRPELYKDMGSPSVENELITYIEENIDFCLGDFSTFTEQGYEIEKIGKPKVLTYINNEGIVVKLDYRIDVNTADGKHVYDKFEIFLSVKLKRIFELATEIINLEKNYSFFERYTENLISVFSMPAPSADRLPPVSATVMEPKSPVIWRRSEAQGMLENVLSTFIPVFQAVNTQNYQYKEFPNNPIKEGIYNAPTIELQTDYSDLDLRFKYLNWWPIYLQINGRGASGEVIMPEMSTTPFPWIMYQKYNYYYDVSYPILMEIYEPNAFDGEGYRFYVAIESNTRRNKPINCTGPGLLGVSEYSTPMFCKHDHWNSGPINITFNTLYTNNTIENVQLNYNCGTGVSCFVAFFDSITNGETRSIVLPSSCRGGLLVAEVEHYRADAVKLNTAFNRSGNATIEMMESRTINVTVKKKPLVRTASNWSFQNAPQWLLKNEMVMVQFNRIEEQGIEDPFTTTMLYYGNNTDLQTIELYPGKYKLDISMIYDLPTPYGQDAVHIPDYEECLGGGLFSDCEKMVIKGMDFKDNFISGGVTFDNDDSNAQDYYITILPDDLYYKDELVIYTLDYFGQDLPMDKLKYPDLEVLGQKSVLSKQYGNSLRPEFVQKNIN